MVKRVDLENKLQSLKEELSFKTQVHEQVGAVYKCNTSFSGITAANTVGHRPLGPGFKYHQGMKGFIYIYFIYMSV